MSLDATAMDSKPVKAQKNISRGYVYDPEVGDVDNGIAAGTAWEDVNEDWVCPPCGVGKDMFSEM